MPLVLGWSVWLISLGRWASRNCTHSYLYRHKYIDREGRSGGAKGILVLWRQFRPRTEAPNYTGGSQIRNSLSRPGEELQ